MISRETENLLEDIAALAESKGMDPAFINWLRNDDDLNDEVSTSLHNLFEYAEREGEINAVGLRKPTTAPRMFMPEAVARMENKAAAELVVQLDKDISVLYEALTQLEVPEDVLTFAMSEEIESRAIAYHPSVIQWIEKTLDGTFDPVTGEFKTGQ